MTTRSASTPLIASSDDYSYEMHVHASPQQIIAAVTDGELICQWWTSAARSEHHADDVRLFMSDGGRLIDFTLDHSAGTDEVVWAVAACVMEDWVGTMPSFSVRQNDEGTCAVEFRHIGLRPALECFDQCCAGWNHFMPSLHRFLETSEGRPTDSRNTSA